MSANGWNLEHSYAQLPPLLHEPCEPTEVKEPRLAVFNAKLASELGLDPAELSQPSAAPLFTGNRLPHAAFPIAQAYAGHQYGHFTTLGDGRAILLGEQITPSGERFDIQLKGAGPTPFSRRGDGRAALGPMLREYLISEAMHALGIPTTRSLAVATTGEPVFRQELLPGAVLTRVAASHIRVGTFEWISARKDAGALRALADYTLQRHYPDLLEEKEPYPALLHAVVERQAALVARWIGVGFVHGVMNTDNMAISGETIDYGPCAFVDAYDPETVFSSIDRYGRYAFSRQPRIAQWNLACLAEAMLGLLHEKPEKAFEFAKEAVEVFPARYQQHWLAVMGAKLGLSNATEEDQPLIDELLGWMHRNHADFTHTFRLLSSENALMRAPFEDCGFEKWHAAWLQRLGAQANGTAEAVKRMCSSNPAVIPRNHLVEAALGNASNNDDLTLFHRLLRVLAMPYDEPQDTAFIEPPAATEIPYETFCGT